MPFCEAEKGPSPCTRCVTADDPVVRVTTEPRHHSSREALAPASLECNYYWFWSSLQQSVALRDGKLWYLPPLCFLVTLLGPLLCEGGLRGISAHITTARYQSVVSYVSHMNNAM
jgi:hypothetical protein